MLSVLTTNKFFFEKKKAWIWAKEVHDEFESGLVGSLYSQRYLEKKTKTPVAMKNL